MEESVKDLEEKLILAKAQVAYNKALDLLKLHTNINGKYYSTHILNGTAIKSSKGSINLRAIKVLDVFVGYYGGRRINSAQDILRLEEPRVFCEAEVITVRISKEGREEFCIDKEILGCPIGGVIREVNEDDYNKLKNFLISQFHSILEKESISNLDPKPIMNYVEGFDKVKKLQDFGYSFVDLTSEEYLTISGWHPYVYGNKLVVSLESKKILEDVIKDYRKLDASDVDYYFAGERIRRNGYYGRQLDILIRINNKL